MVEMLVQRLLGELQDSKKLRCGWARSRQEEQQEQGEKVGNGVCWGNTWLNWQNGNFEASWKDKLGFYEVRVYTSIGE